MSNRRIFFNIGYLETIDNAYSIVMCFFRKSHETGTFRKIMHPMLELFTNPPSPPAIELFPAPSSQPPVSGCAGNGARPSGGQGHSQGRKTRVPHIYKVTDNETAGVCSTGTPFGFPIRTAL